MSENNEMLEKKAEDEVSLLDLLAVLIRRRKLIVITTIVAFVLGVLWLFAYPKIVKSASERKVQVIYSGQLEKIAPDLASYLSMDIAGLAERELRNYVNFAKVQKPYYVFTEDNLTERQYNSAIKQLIDQRKFAVSVSRGSSTITISSELYETKVEDYKKFITEYVAYCANNIEKNVAMAMENASSNIDELIERNEASENSSSDLANLLSIRLAIKNYTDTHEQIITVDEDPFEIDIALGRMKKLAIITAAAFFISIFIAFLLNAIENIKKDPEASKLISDAWKAGK